MRVDLDIAVFCFVALLASSLMILSAGHTTQGVQPYALREVAGPTVPGFVPVPPTGLLARAVPDKVQQTVIITGIDLNDRIGSDVDVLTGDHLTSLRGGIIQTQAGTTRYNQYLRLLDTQSPSLNGGQLVYTQDEDGNVGDFIKFTSNQPLFEYHMQFNPGLEGELVDGESDDLEDESLVLMGAGAFISRVEASGTRIRIRFVTSIGEIEFEDADVTDNAFERGVEINGENSDATVRIKGRVTGNLVRILSIEYRPEARALQGDIFVAPRYGVRGFLMDPASLLSPGFDIIYGGLSTGAPKATTTQLTPSISGDKVILRGSGDEYDLFFTNVRGQQYKVPVYALNGGITLGDNDRDLVVVEGSNSADFNIDEGDYFMVSSGTSTSSVTNVLRLNRVDSDRIYVQDLSNGDHEDVYDTSSGEGTLLVSGRSYRFVADESTGRIVVDQTGDGSFNGDRARIILTGGVQLELFGSSMVLRVPENLFKDDSPGTDETTTIQITEDDGDIDATVSDQGTLDMEQARDRIERGMTLYGVLFELDDDRSPATLALTIPRGQRTAIVQTTSLSGGQNRGWIVVTSERERFMQD